MVKQIEVRMKWDSWNAALIISKLFRHVSKEEISFGISATKEKKKTSIKIEVSNKMSADDFLQNIIITYIKKRIYSLARQGEKLDVPEIFLDDKPVEYKIEYNKTLVKKGMEKQGTLK